MMTLEQHYEHGLKTLKERARNTQWWSDFLNLEARLHENLSQTSRYGDTETRRADRAQIVDALNDLALQHLGVDFNDLCRFDSLSEAASSEGPLNQVSEATSPSTSGESVVNVKPGGSIETTELSQKSEGTEASSTLIVGGKIQAEKINVEAKGQ